MLTFFVNLAWDYARYVSQRRTTEIYRQGFLGVTIAQQAEIAYTGLIDTWKKLNEEFELRKYIVNRNTKRC
ncbi:fructose 1,6-bisphosphatase [Candidatus Coxiella mudrowiae]|uniref:fructose 1,6-bisphosphatase n=1 Tax=Candidatus Coxiella mudrowiae TaxID=2054173 RepID=UPI0027D249A2|nr:fructose 1,6-bisphosphatase [Candidatus Coxiella mudrowiae]